MPPGATDTETFVPCVTAVTATVAASGLRGRGGAGYPTGDKWRACANTDAPRRYVVANGYGADPASHTDRTLLLRDPFSVVEGVAITSYAIGATEAFIASMAHRISPWLCPGDPYLPAGPVEAVNLR